MTHKVVKKDPPKVEAGQKGAAVRNAKQKALLEQLQEAKEGFHDRTAAEAGVSAAAPESDSVASTEWTAYALAGAAVAVGAAALWYVRSAPQQPPVSTNTKTVLNKQPDLFYME